MSNKERRKAPVLRFKGFTDDWEQRKLNTYLSVSKLKNKEERFSKQDVLSVSGDFGIVNQIKFQGRSFAGKSLSNYKIVKNGDIVYTKSPLKAAPYGIIKSNGGIPGIVSTLYAVYTPKKSVDSKFVELFFNDQLRLNRYLKPIVNIGAKHDMKVKNDEVINHFVTFPNKKEQLKISKLLQKMDDVISLQQRKLKELKQIKGSLLTKILAGKNSNQPILRFRNFKNNWKQYRLKDLYTYSNGKAHEQSQQLNGKYELINLNSISIDGSLKSSGKYVNKSKDILKKNDLVMVLSDIAHGLLLGRVAVIPKDNKYVLNQRIALLRPQKNDENSNFMASLINNNQSYFHRMGSGTSQLNISKSAVTESKWFIPEPDEQLAIGNLLKEIDNYIFLQQDKINQLTALRKFLSQNLFI